VISIIHPVDFSSLENYLFPNGVFTPRPSEKIKAFDENMLRYFCMQKGIYALPTEELVSDLQRISSRVKMIELAAGTGLLGSSVGISMYDNKMQEWPAIKAEYQRLKQPTITYGAGVIQKDGLQAVRDELPDVVVSSWMTSKYIPMSNEGNPYGVDELTMMDHIWMYIHIGNESVHSSKMSLLKDFEPYRVLNDQLVSRSARPELNAIYVFRNEKNKPDGIIPWGSTEQYLTHLLK
jgi:hypothetical protein